MTLLPARLSSVALALGLSSVLGAAQAADPAPAASGKPAAKTAAKNATKNAAAKTATKPAAKAAEPAEPATEAQLAVAARVLTGDADCEFKQKIAVTPVEGHAGHFNQSFRNVTYRMVPQETTTGAVRMEDKKSGMVWIQIPAKSMLMNSKLGQRVVDDCTHPEQRAAVAAAKAAGESQQAGSIGIAPVAGAPAASASTN